MGVVESGAPTTVVTSLRPRKEDFAFIGEVTKERALGQPGTFRDVRDSGLIEATFAVELHRRLGEPPSTVRFPSHHSTILFGVDSR
jgi:hypothetical protein